MCPLKSGKEADLFVVERAPYHYVAKVYRERKVRSFKNDAGYREGRTVRNSRAQRALSKGTRYGQRLAEETWHMAEVDALRKLGAAGARVPRVLAHHDRVLIMELICDERGQLAPQLAQVPMSPAEAREAFDTILGQVILLLLNDLIHGDLSPYNVLIGTQGPVIIDMPQCVSAAHNKQAALLLERDVAAITRHLGLTDPAIRAYARETWQIWAEYEGGTLCPEFRPELGRRRENEVDDLGGLVEFVQAARDEADLEKRAADGCEDARALLRAAERRAAKQARRVAEAREAAAEAEREERRRAARRQAGGEAPAGKRQAGGDGPAGKRRRRRSRQGDAQTSDRASGAPAGKGPTGADGDGKRRGRRGRRSGGPAEPAAPTRPPERPAAGDREGGGRRRRRGRRGRGPSSDAPQQPERSGRSAR